jgi:hypothetical protein
MDRGRVGEDRGSKETDGCPLTIGVDFVVHSHRTFDWHIVDVGDGDMRDFSL